MSNKATEGLGPEADATQKFEGRILTGRYQLLARLGSGGFGSVFKARDLLLDRVVAIKMLHASRSISEEVRERFLREARATARLHHENVVTLFDAGEADGELYMVLEYVEGTTLRDRLKDGPLDASAAARLIVEVARALEAAHALGIVHRDIKPANILISNDGRVKVADFGVARLIDAPDLTRDGAMIGTPRYMSPEQLDGERIGPESDLYSLGCVAYEALTGETSRANPTSLPAALAPVIDALLRPNPSERPTAAAIQQMVEGGAAAPARPRHILWAAAAAVLIALAALAIWFTRDASLVVRSVPVREPQKLVDLIASRTGTAGERTSRRVVGKMREAGHIVIAGIGFHLRADRNRVEIRAEERHADHAVEIVRLYNSFRDYDFGNEPNRVVGDGESQKSISLSLKGVEAHRIVEIIASAANWPLAIDPSAAEAVKTKLADAALPDLRVEAPWDAVVVSLLSRYDLDVFRFQRAWLLVSKKRLKEIDQRRNLVVASSLVYPHKLDDAVRAAGAASSLRGSVLGNRRLNELIITDYPEVIGRQEAILEAIGAKPGEGRKIAGRSETQRYLGQIVHVHVEAIPISEFLNLVSRFTGLSLVIDPAVRDTITLHLREIPWDEAVDVAMSVGRASYAMKSSVIEVHPEAAKPAEEVIVETLTLKREDPQFFEPWGRSLAADGGSLLIDRDSRALIIRGPRSRVESFRNTAGRIDARVSQGAIVRMTDEIIRGGLSAGQALQLRLAKTSRDYPFDESNWNEVGYRLLGKNENESALAVFSWMAREHPQSANAYDSLAEAYMKSGQQEHAIANYRKSLELDPDNHNAKTMLKKLEAQR